MDNEYEIEVQRLICLLNMHMSKKYYDNLIKCGNTVRLVAETYIFYREFKNNNINLNIIL